MAAVLTVLTLLGGGTAVWALTHRQTRFVSDTGKVAVTLDGPWSPSPALVPGESTGEGVRLVDGNRAVSVAWAPVDTSAEDVAGRLTDAGCPQPRRQDVTAGTLRGVTETYTGCPDGGTVSVSGLADPDHHGWVMWLEVRSVDGTPTNTEVLGSLSVQA